MGLPWKWGVNQVLLFQTHWLICIGNTSALKMHWRFLRWWEGNDIFSWNSIVSIHEQCGDHDGTLRLLDRLLCAGTQPDLVIVTTVLLACSHLIVLMHGREIHGYMIVSGLGKVGNYIDDVLLKMHLMHNHCL